MAIKLFRHIQNFDKQYNAINKVLIYFAKYEYKIEQGLLYIRKKVEYLIFMEKVGLEDGMSRRASEELWQYENRYDSDNETTFDSDNVVMLAVCCARGSGDKLVTRKKEKESNKLVAARETSWSHSGR